MYKINIYSKEKGGGKVQEDNRRLYTKAIWYLVIATITMLLINIFSICAHILLTQTKYLILRWM